MSSPPAPGSAVGSAREDIPLSEPPAETGANGETGLPLLRTWPAVYAFVLGVFIVLVILLTLFTRAYS